MIRYYHSKLKQMKTLDKLVISLPVNIILMMIVWVVAMVVGNLLNLDIVWRIFLDTIIGQFIVFFVTVILIGIYSLYKHIQKINQIEKQNYIEVGSL